MERGRVGEGRRRKVVREAWRRPSCHCDPLHLDCSGHQAFDCETKRFLFQKRFNVSIFWYSGIYV